MRGQALAAGVADDRLREVKLEDEFTPATYNDPQRSEGVTGVFKTWFGDSNVIKKKPSMGLMPRAIGTETGKRAKPED